MVQISLHRHASLADMKGSQSKDSDEQNKARHTKMIATLGAMSADAGSWVFYSGTIVMGNGICKQPS